MNATQVERTLVKSAPEIWAELSDPAALARHLDPVGEIRITCAQPEEKIEWEADGACGSVLIEPSGWGTRVTLTMTREEERAQLALAEPEPQPPAEPQAVAWPPAQAPAEPEPQAPGEAQAQALAEPQAPPEPEPQAPAESQAQALAEPQAYVAADVEPHQAADPEPQPPGPAEATHDRDRASTPHAQTEPRHELLPRRGFLARLLRRRTRRTARADDGATPSHGLTICDAGVSPWPTASPEWVEQFPARRPDAETAPAVAGPEATPEHTLVAHDMPSDDPGTDVDATASGGDEGSPEPPVEDGADPGAVIPPESAMPHGAVEAPDAADAPDATPEPEAKGLDHRDAGAGEAADGETADGETEEDEAVLSAVLDRLGAAHHRPFSRA